MIESTMLSPQSQARHGEFTMLSPPRVIALRRAGTPMSS